MDVHEALLSRRTAHRWTRDPVPESIVERALLAAHHAPCHKLTWPWRFTRVGPEARARITALGVRLKTDKGVGEDAAERTRAKLANPAHLVVVSQVTDPDPFRAREDYAAIACAIENLMLSLRGDGVFSKWSTGALTRHPEVRALLDVPEGEEIVGFVWIGHPDQEPRTPRRPPLTDVVRRVP